MKKKKLECVSIDQSRSIKDLLQIAVQCITNMQRRHGKNCMIEMICGPLFTGNGTDEERLDRFQRTIRARRRAGYFVFDQLPFRHALNRLQSYPGQILIEFFKPLFYYLDRLVFLPGWRYSIGARFERAEAKWQRVLVYDI